MVQWLWETHLQEAVSSNPDAVYWMDTTFFTFICFKNCIVCLKRPKINEKEAEVGPFKKIYAIGSGRVEQEDKIISQQGCELAIATTIVQYVNNSIGYYKLETLVGCKMFLKGNATYILVQGNSELMAVVQNNHTQVHSQNVLNETSKLRFLGSKIIVFTANLRFEGLFSGSLQHRMFLIMGLSRPLFVYFRLFYMSQFKYNLIKAQMVCLGFKPGAAGWKAQMNPLRV